MSAAGKRQKVRPVGQKTTVVNRENFQRAVDEDRARHTDFEFEAGSTSTTLTMPNTDAYSEAAEMRAYASMSGGGAASGGAASSTRSLRDW